MTRLLSGATAAFRLSCTAQSPSGPGLRQLQVAPLAVGERDRFIAIHADQAELAATRQALRTASEQITIAKDEQRQCIAMELHDSTCQHLAEIGLCIARPRRTEPGIDAAILMRILPEALLNADRHSGARHVTVGLTVEKGRLTLAVSDDGRGLGSRATPVSA